MQTHKSNIYIRRINDKSYIVSGGRERGFQLTSIFLHDKSTQQAIYKKNISQHNKDH